MSTKTPSIAIIGAGIVGASAAYYLTNVYGHNVSIYDEGTGQATSAAAGILCPWLSRRRNKEWYRLVKEGAAMYPSFLEQTGVDLNTSLFYKNTGALFLKKDQKKLDTFTEFARTRQQSTPAMGTVSQLTPEDIKRKIPFYEGTQSGLFVSGGSRVDGGMLVEHLLEVSVKKGATVYPTRAHVSKGNEKNYVLMTENAKKEYDVVILAVGAWLPQLLEPLGYSVDIRAQKGQLALLNLPYKETNEMPVVIPEGEKDILFFSDGQTVIGATHENDQGYDLTIQPDLVAPMIQESIDDFSSLFTQSESIHYRVGTRAYTSDFASFIGEVPGLSSLFAASGLGSSGLTAGPLVGKMLAQMVQGEQTDLPLCDYPIEKYIQQTDLR